jgi:thioredoxin-related protein
MRNCFNSLGLIAGILAVLSLCSCQASFNIRPDSLPKKLNNAHEIQLISLKGTRENLSTIYEEHQATVVIFWQISCPCVKRYEKRIEELYRRYHHRHVAFLYVSSNANESFSEIRGEYQKRSNLLPLFRDEEGRLAKTIGVRGTPTGAIINQKGEVVFLGWLDNERNEQEKDRIPYLENALEDIMHKRTIETNTSPMFGCPIR